MSREWQQTKFAEYVMPDTVYYQSIWAVRDLDRMEKRLMELKAEGPSSNGKSVVNDTRGSFMVYRPTEKSAFERIILEDRIQGIRKALETVPEKHRYFILNNVALKVSGKDYPYKMWGYWKQRFLYHVAKNLSIM